MGAVRACMRSGELERLGSGETDPKKLVRKGGRMNCKICENEVSCSLSPFCSFECGDYYIQNNQFAKSIVRKDLNYGKCSVCGIYIYTRNRRKYCSIDCQKVYANAHNRRETMPFKYRNEILRKYNYLCIYCGEEANAIDHIYPVSKGGRTIKENLVAACKSCNSTASNKTFESLEKKKQYILSKRNITNHEYQEDLITDYKRPKWHSIVNF